MVGKCKLLGRARCGIKLQLVTDDLVLEPNRRAAELAGLKQLPFLIGQRADQWKPTRTIPSSGIDEIFKIIGKCILRSASGGEQPFLLVHLPIERISGYHPASFGQQFPHLDRRGVS